MPNDLDPDQNRRAVSPDLIPKIYLHISKVAADRQRVNEKSCSIKLKEITMPGTAYYLSVGGGGRLKSRDGVI